MDSGTRGFKCNFSKCDQVFLSENQLKKHLKDIIHRNQEWMHKCQYLQCQMAYANTILLRQHLVEVHGMAPRVVAQA